MILQAIHVLIALQKKQKKENKLKDNKTKRQQYKKTKPKKRVYYCDVWAVLHSYVYSYSFFFFLVPISFARFLFHFLRQVTLVTKTPKPETEWLLMTKCANDFVMEPLIKMRQMTNFDNKFVEEIFD